VYHLHGLPYESAAGLHRFLQISSERLACALATKVLSVSESVRARVLEDHLCSHEKIEVPESGSIAGIDAEGLFDPLHHSEAGTTVRKNLGIPSDGLVIGFVGRLAKDKGVETLWTAWRRLRQTRHNIYLLVIGPGENARPDQAVSPEILKSLQSDPRVHVLGFVPRTELPHYYAAIDVLTLPTLREGFPVTVLEAAAMGIPCVASRVTGCIDAIVSEKTGLLTKAKDPEALASAIDRYLATQELRATHGAAARARVLRLFRPERLWSAYHRVYRANRKTTPSLVEDKPTETPFIS